MDMDQDHFEALLSGIEVSSPSGQAFIVKAAPRGVPLQNDNAPSTSIVVDLVWNIYLGVASAFSRRWKVAVIRSPGRFLRRNHIVHREILPSGVLPDQKLHELADRCREGAFEDPGAGK